MQTINTALDWIKQLENLPPGAETVVVCIALGYVLKFVPEFPNARIPLVNLIFGGLYYCLTVPYSPANPLVVAEGMPLGARVRNFGIGLVLGAAAWLIHAQLLKRIEDSALLTKYLPALGTAFANAKDNPPAAYPEQKP